MKGFVERMMSFLAIMLFWYILPMIMLFACSFLMSTFSLTERWEIKAPDLAIPFLFMGIHELSEDSYDGSIIPYFVISILLLGAAVALLQAYYYGEILHRRCFKMFRRLMSLLTFVLCALLILLNISHYLL